MPELEEMLDRLRESAALRQAASRIMLDVAKYLSVSFDPVRGRGQGSRAGPALCLAH
jgi:hypothetical protein